MDTLTHTSYIFLTFFLQVHRSSTFGLPNSSFSICDLPVEVQFKIQIMCSVVLNVLVTEESDFRFITLCSYSRLYIAIYSYDIIYNCFRKSTVSDSKES